MLLALRKSKNQKYHIKLLPSPVYIKHHVYGENNVTLHAIERICSLNVCNLNFFRSLQAPNRVFNNSEIRMKIEMLMREKLSTLGNR